MSIHCWLSEQRGAGAPRRGRRGGGGGGARRRARRGGPRGRGGGAGGARWPAEGQKLMSIHCWHARQSPPPPPAPAPPPTPRAPSPAHRVCYSCHSVLPLTTPIPLLLMQQKEPPHPTEAHVWIMDFPEFQAYFRVFGGFATEGMCFLLLPLPPPLRLALPPLLLHRNAGATGVTVDIAAVAITVLLLPSLSPTTLPRGAALLASAPRQNPPSVHSSIHPPQPPAQPPTPPTHAPLPTALNPPNAGTILQEAQGLRGSLIEDNEDFWEDMAYVCVSLHSPAQACGCLGRHVVCTRPHQSPPTRSCTVVWRSTCTAAPSSLMLPAPPHPPTLTTNATPPPPHANNAACRCTIRPPRCCAVTTRWQCPPAKSRQGGGWPPGERVRLQRWLLAGSNER